MPSPETASINLTEWTREELIQRVRELDAQKVELESQLRETQEKLAEAQAFIAELQRQLFGPKAEKLSSEQEKQLEQLASDLREEAQKPSPLIQQVLVEEHRRRRPRPQRHPLPPLLETVTVTLEPESQTCPHCGVEGQRIGEEVSEEFDLIPAKLIRRRTVRPKYAFPCGEGGVAIAPLPPRLIAQSKLGLGLAVHIVLARYDDHLSFFALERRTLTVGRSKTEGSSGRVIPLNIVAYAALVRWASRFPEATPEDYVFPSCEAAGIEREHPDAERIDPSRPIKSWRSAWRRARKDAGLNIRFHDLRHTCITKLAEGQASEQTLMSIAGHLSAKMLEHYSHIRMARKRTALDAIVKPVFDADVAQNWAQSPSVEKTAAPN